MRKETPIASEIEILTHIFKHYCCPDELYSFEQQQKILPELQKEGFDEEKIFQAFDWLMMLGVHQTGSLQASNKNFIRFFSPEEIAKLDIECVNFITSLTTHGILNCNSREILINQLMQLQRNHISLVETKWVTYLVLRSCSKAHKSINDEIEKFYLMISSDNNC